MDKHIMLKRLTAAGLALTLLAAACTPSTPVGTPLGTEILVGTTIPTTPVASAQATTGGLETAEGTEVGTAVGTAEGTAVGTAEGTAEGTAVGTAEGTAEGTAVGTAEGTAEGTAVGTAEGTPNANQEPSVLLSSELIGSTIVDQDGASVGTVNELLVDDQGLVQYVIFDAFDLLNDSSDDATPEVTSEATAVATSDATAEDTGLRAVPQTTFQVNANAEDDEQVLMYTGTADDLRSMGAFNQMLLDDDTFVIDASQSSVAADTTYDGLIRLSMLDDFDLKNAAGDELGETEDAILDLNEQMVKYGVVDFGGFLGIGEQTAAVPWSLITVEQTGDTPNMTLQANTDTLETAPTIDLGDWPKWSERVDSNSNWTLDWELQIRTFWDGAASQ